MLSTWNSWYSGCLQGANYKSFVEQNASCSIYTPNTHMYASCKLEEITSKTIYSNDPISCDNMYVYSDSCKRLQLIQEAIKNKDSNMCGKINTLDSGLSGTYSQYALCI